MIFYYHPHNYDFAFLSLIHVITFSPGFKSSFSSTPGRNTVLPKLSSIYDMPHWRKMLLRGEGGTRCIVSLKLKFFSSHYVIGPKTHILANRFPHSCLSFSTLELQSIALASNSSEALAHRISALCLCYSLRCQTTFMRKMRGNHK